MRRRDRTSFLVVHCSATRPGQNIGAEQIRGWHLERGFEDIGYHYVIRRDGRIEKGRDIAYAGAHVQNHNSDSIGICLVGGLNQNGKPENNFTAAQFASLKDILTFLRAIWPAAEILGHRDFSPDLDGDGVISPNEWFKVCPCFDVRAWASTEGFARPPDEAA